MSVSPIQVAVEYPDGRRIEAMVALPRQGELLLTRGDEWVVRDILWARLTNDEPLYPILMVRSTREVGRCRG